MVLGRLQAGSLALGEVDLDLCHAETAISATLAEHLKVSTKVAAHSVAEAVEDSLATAARAHAAEHGLDLPKHVLVAFGGAAPLRAASLAEKLGIETVLIPPDASVGSAIGFFSAPLAFEALESYSMRLRNFNHQKINSIFRQLWHKTVSVVAAGAARWKPGRPPKERRRAYMRYVGQGHEVSVDLPNRDLEAEDPMRLKKDFELEYVRLGFIPLLFEEVEFCAFALEVVADADPLAWPRERLHAKQGSVLDKSILHSSGVEVTAREALGKRFVYDKHQEVEHLVYQRSDLLAGDFIPGPAVICEDYTTTIVSEAFNCWVLENGFLQLQTRKANVQNFARPKALAFQDQRPYTEDCLAHRLAWTRLLAIVEEQARSTLRTSFSTLLRECRAVSCAVLCESGKLLAQSEISSPSLMGILLSMEECLPDSLQKLSRGESMVHITSGCMLQHSDLIVLTPVFEGDARKPSAYIASVAHVTMMLHASYVVSRATVSNSGVTAKDAAALMASNELCLGRLLTLLTERSVTMAGLGAYIISESKEAVLRTLQLRGASCGGPVQAKKNITVETKGAEADSKGLQVRHVELAAELNFNEGLHVKVSAHELPKADSEALRGSPGLCMSFCKFALMSSLGHGIPVNAGSLDVFHIQISGDLNARSGAIDASQVACFLPDLLFECLWRETSCPADSASCLSSLAWKANNDFFGLHIEGGGMGAHSDQDGISGCIFPSGFQAMPVEITESSCAFGKPSLLLTSKELIIDSGGAGCFRGGLGVRWQLLAQSPVKVTVLQGCCVDGPAGRAGGFSGKPFLTELKRKQRNHAELERDERDLLPGDVLILETPGGGGYGPPAKRCRKALQRDLREGYVSDEAAVMLYKLEDLGEKQAAVEKTTTLMFFSRKKFLSHTLSDYLSSFDHFSRSVNRSRSRTERKVGVSKNFGTPKSSILIGFSIINHPFWGTPIFGNTQVFCDMVCKDPFLSTQCRMADWPRQSM